MRYVIAGLAVACIVAASVLAYGRLTTTTADQAQTWRQQELLFLTAALGRVQAELEQRPAGSGTASLRREQEELIQAMAATSNPASGGRGPDGAKTSPRTPAAPQQEARDVPTSEAVAVPRSVDLRLGLNTGRIVAPDLAGLDFNPDLRAPLNRRKVTRKEPTDKPTAEKAAGPPRQSTAAPERGAGGSAVATSP